MSQIDDSRQSPDSALVECLQAFVQGSEARASVIVWAEALSPQDRERLRSDLAVLLAEPELTGEPLDWPEIAEILEEWAEVAGWNGSLVAMDGPTREGLFSIEMRAREEEALASAPLAVQRAARVLFDTFLTLYPASGERLPRGQIKKLKNRDLWQIDLPDGYRLRYLVDKLKRTVHIVYLGPHRDGDLRGREQTVRSQVNRSRRDGTTEPRP